MKYANFRGFDPAEEMNNIPTVMESTSGRESREEHLGEQEIAFT